MKHFLAVLFLLAGTAFAAPEDSLPTSAGDAATEPAGKERTFIALFDLNPQGGIDNSITFALSDQLRNELLNTGFFDLASRTQIQEMLKKEKSKPSHACLTDSCATRIGTLLGVPYVVVGTIDKQGSRFALETRLIDVNTGRVARKAENDCECDISEIFKKSTVDIARKLAGHFHAEGHPEDGASEDSLQDFDDSWEPDVPSRSSVSRGRSRLRWSLGVGALAFLTAGLVMNFQQQAQIDEAYEVSSRYKASPTNDSYAAFAEQYASNLNRARQKKNLRNLCYGLGAASLAGFSITWIF